MRVVVAGASDALDALADGLAREGLIVTRLDPHDLLDELDSSVDALLLPITRRALSPELLGVCDRAGIRIVPLGTGEPAMLARYGLPAAIPLDTAPWRVADALRDDAPSPAAADADAPHRVIAVWGPPGAPGRSTVAIQLAAELAHSTPGRTLLVDADTVAPSVALLLGLGDDAPGIAAACRRAELGGLDALELERLAEPVRTNAGVVDVLAGLNRPGRWPELSASRLRSALRACRAWATTTVVDVSDALDADEELTDDLAGPRRHAASTVALQEADHILAVVSADPLSISRLIRAHADLRRLVGAVPVTVVANRVRPGPLGVDARGQIRRTLERFAGITDVRFLPWDQRAADAALLHARPMADVTPRSAFVGAVRRLASVIDGTEAAPPATAGSSRGSSRGVRWLRPARAARAASRRAGDPVSAS